MITKFRLESFAILLALSVIFLLSNVSLVSAGWFDNWGHDDSRDKSVPGWMGYYSVLSKNNDYDIAWSGPYKGGNLMVTVHGPREDTSRYDYYENRDSVRYNSGANSYYRNDYSKKWRYTEPASSNVKSASVSSSNTQYTSRSSGSSSSSASMYRRPSFGSW